MGDDLVGLYLHGSLALGAFDPAESDVDFLVATEHELERHQIARLAALHTRLGDRLDGSYMPRDVFRRFDPSRVMHPHIESRGGVLSIDDHGGETVIYRHVLRKHGITVVGPQAHDLIDPIAAEELRWGVCDTLENWWRPMLERPPTDLLESPYRAYAVVTMCRIRFTLETGDVVSKPVAAEWALAHVDERWRGLVARAAARDECGYEETVAFVRDTLVFASC